MLWLTKPHPKANSCLILWRNMFTLQKMCPITSIDIYSSVTPEGTTLKVIIGDEMGYIRIQDLSQIIPTMDVKPVDIVQNNLKRNPWRIFSIDKGDGGVGGGKFNESEHASETASSIEVESGEATPLLEEGYFKQEAQWKGHNDAIKYIKYIDNTDTPLVFTAGLDKMARIWNIKGELQGSLRQGFMNKPCTSPMSSLTLMLM